MKATMDLTTLAPTSTIAMLTYLIPVLARVKECSQALLRDCQALQNFLCRLFAVRPCSSSEAVLDSFTGERAALMSAVALKVAKSIA